METTEKTVVTTLLSLFETQKSLQAELQAQSEKLRSAILSRELELVSAVVHNIDEITEKTELLEVERRKAVAAELGSEANKSFDALLRTLNDEDRELLKTARNELKEAVKTTARKNTMNRLLLEETLSSIKTSVKIMTGSAKPSTGYDFTGKSSTNQRKFINQVG